MEQLLDEDDEGEDDDDDDEGEGEDEDEDNLSSCELNYFKIFFKENTLYNHEKIWKIDEKLMKNL